MFRKPVALSGEHAVSGSDRKKLRRALAAALGADDATLDALLPAKADLRVAKLSPPSRASLYTCDGAPWLLDRSSKGDYVPCLPALWRAPSLLRRLTLRHADVARFLLGGADLMLPGVAISAAELASLREGQLAAAYVPGNPAAVAVGTVALSGAEAAARGGKGRLLEVFHVFGDSLWELTPAAAATPDGFTRHAVAPLPGCETGESNDGELDERGEGDEAAAQDDEERADCEDDKDIAAADAAKDDAPAEAGAAAAPAAPVSAAEADALLDAALLQALKLCVKDGELPMSASALWAQHVLPSRPAGSTLDVKRSSHRKLSAFVAAKAAEGWLNARNDKRTGEPQITAVNRRHPAVLAHAPHAAAADAAASSSDAAAESAPNAPPPPLHIEQLVVPSSATRPIFAAVGVADAPMDERAATDALWRYCAAFCSADSNAGGAVVLDPQLCDALYKGTLKKGEPAPTQLPRAALAAAFLARCTRGRRVWRGAGEAPDPPPPLQRGALPPVHLSLANRAGGKKVTLVRGVEAYLVDPEALAQRLKAHFAASCALTELPRAEGSAPSRAPPPQELCLQGERAAGVAALLEQQWGVPRACISLPPGAEKKEKKASKR